MIWEYIKYEIKKFFISFSEQYAKCKQIKTFILQKKLKQLEANANFNFNEHYLECKNNLEKIFQEKANGIKMRSKCNWYGFGEKSSKFSLTQKSSMRCKTKLELSFVAKMKLQKNI